MYKLITYQNNSEVSAVTVTLAEGLRQLAALQAQQVTARLITEDGEVVA